MKSGVGYFAHDCNARNDERILELRERWGPEGYAFFFMLCEIMAENETGEIFLSRLGGYSLSLGVDRARLSAFVEDCRALELFIEISPGALSSRRMQEHKAARKKMSEGAKRKRSGAGGKAEGINPPVYDGGLSHTIPASPEAFDKISRALESQIRILDLSEGPRAELEIYAPEELKIFQMQFQSQLQAIGALWSSVIEKFDASLIAENALYPRDRGQRLKQYLAKLRRYLLSWISRAAEQKKSGSPGSGEIKREVKG